MNLTNYLDRELGRNNGPDNFESDLTELIGVDGYLEFQDICNNLNYTCSNTYSSTEDLINAENDFYNFMYSSEASLLIPYVVMGVIGSFSLIGIFTGSP